MRRIDGRPQQACRDRLYAAPANCVQHIARLRLVERGHDAAFGIDPFANLESQPARYVRRRKRNLQAEGVEFAAFAQDEDIGKPFRDEKRGTGGLALDDCIRRVSGAVDQQGGLLEHRRDVALQLFGDHFQRAFDSAKDAIDSRRRLADNQIAVFVGEEVAVDERSRRVDLEYVPQPARLIAGWPGHVVFDPTARTQVV